MRAPCSRDTDHQRTEKQGCSGLGLDAQREAARGFARQHEGKLLREFTEVESGRKAERPELEQAVAFARRAGAVLLVAKLDRLARNVAFLSRLMESGVDFVAADNPHANRFTVHILAAVAEWERDQISTRTKDALRAAKARGVRLGSNRPGHWNGREESRRQGARKGNAKAAKVISEKARAEYSDLRPRVRDMRETGLSLRKIADALNAEGHRTRRGAAFGPSQVQRILAQ